MTLRLNTIAPAEGALQEGKIIHLKGVRSSLRTLVR